VEIRIVVPDVGKRFEAAARMGLSPAARSDTELSVVSLDRGPASIESRYEEALAVPDTIAKIVQAEKDGVDAVMVDCMQDVGVAEGREKVSIPVIGPAETAMHIAGMLGHKFSVIAALDRFIPIMHDRAVKTGQTERLASVRAVSMPVLDMPVESEPGSTCSIAGALDGTDDQPSLLKALVDEAAKAVREDGAHVIVFGCAGMTGLAEAVEEGLRREGITDVPVLDPPILGLKIAEALAEMGLSHSKRTYPAPPQKEIVGY